MAQWLKNFLGNTPTRMNETVATLLDRIKTASREDRRKAISDLKKFCSDPRYVQEIGKVLDVLVDFMRTDKKDPAIVEVVEILLLIMKETNNEDQLSYTNNIEFFVKDKENLLLLLSLLEENDKVKFQATRLLTVLLTKKLAEVQDVMLSAAVIPNLVELLKSSDMIRNEILLLMKELSRNNLDVQKIITFAGAFDMLFDIMKEEQMSNGGIVVQDCLCVLNNLLRENPTNINSFRENGLIRRFSPLLELEQSDVYLLTEDKTEIILQSLETVSLLTTGTNPQDIYSSQTALNGCGVLFLVLKLALGGVNSPSIRSKALWTLGHLICGHSNNCAKFRDSHFSSVTNQKAKHSVLRVLNITFSSKVYKERRASLHTLQCYLHGNEDAQIALASTVTPPPIENLPNDEETVGRILLRKLTNWEKDEDNLSPWYACIMLSYIINENRPCKELLLRIQLEIPKQGGSVENLFSKTTRELVKAIKTKADVQIQVGMLRLLSVWVYDCPLAIQNFLQSSSHTQFLVELIGQRSTNLHVAGLSALVIGLCLLSDNSDIGSGLLTMVVQKIGVDKYGDCLMQIVKSEDFVNAEQGKSHMHTEDMNKLMFYDYDYTLFFQRAHQQVLSKLKPETTKNKTTNSTSNARDQTLVQYYQDLLASQDLKIKTYENKINQLQLEASLSAGTDQASQQLLQQIKDRDSQIIELQTKVATYEKEMSNFESLQSEVAKLKEENEDLNTEKKNNKQNKTNLKQKLTIENQKNIKLEARIFELTNQLETNEVTNNTNLTILHTRIEQLEQQLKEKNESFTQVEQEQEELYVLLAQKTLEIKKLRRLLGLPDEEEEGEGDGGD